MPATMSVNTPIVIFDIETIPDIVSGRRMNPMLEGLSDADTQQAMIAMRQAEADSDFMRLPLHKVACLSMLWVDLANNQMKLKSFSLEDMSEDKILSTFFGVFNTKKLPNLVSWNGSGFDIPVMLYRAMHHKITAPTFFNDMGDMKYNNYLNRYHNRHLDLMDKMALYGYKRQPLDTVAGVCGFAGKQDIDGSMVVNLVNTNDWQTLTTYCESDVLNTWLLYVRWQLLTGAIDHATADSLENLTRNYVSTIQNVSSMHKDIAEQTHTTESKNAESESESENTKSKDTANNVTGDLPKTEEASIRHARFLKSWAE